MRWLMRESRGLILMIGIALTIGWVGSPRVAAMETLTVGGTGTAAPLIEQLATQYKNLQPAVSVRVVSPPMGSNASIRAVLAGAIDLAAAGRPLSDEEMANGGRYWPLGRTAFVFATSKKGSYAGFSVAQLAAIYSGQVTQWPDGSPIRLILRTPMESDTLALRKMSPVMDRAVEAASARTGMLSADNDLENLELLERTPDSLGTTTLALIQSRNAKVVLLPIDGVQPTLSNVKMGAYPYQKIVYIAQGAKLTPMAQAFLDFVLSSAGQRIIEQAGYLPVDRQP